MTGVRVVALSPAGIVAIQRHCDEVSKGRANGVKRLYRTITNRQDPVRESIVCQDPLTLEVRIVDPFILQAVKPSMLSQKAHEVMRLNGASKADYRLEVLR